MSDYSYMLLRTLLALGLVIGLLVALLYFFRLLSGKAGQRGGPGAVRVLARSFLAHKSSIAVVEVAGQVLVIGVCANSLCLLTRIDDEDVIKDLRARGSGGSATGGGLAALLGIWERVGR